MLRTGIYVASQLQTANNETLLLIDPDVINGAHVLDNEDLHAAIEAQGITTLIVNDGDIPMTSIPAYSGYLVFNRTLAKAGHWPAIDRLHSHASTQITTIQSEQHKRIATHVQEILQQGEALQAISSPTHEEQAILARARRLNLFFTQPFLVAEPYSGIPGEHVPLEETLQNCQALLSGSYDTLPEQAFLMVGTLEQAIEKSKQLK
jgi:F-type H+-transporting ATPase subunit beta